MAERWRIKGRDLNNRQKYFAQVVLERGYYVALRCAGYNKMQGARLLKDPRFKAYQMSLITEAMNEINLTLADLIEKRVKIADDIDTPPKLRDDILKDLINMVHNTASDVNERMKLLKPQKMLKPSKEIPYEEIPSQEIKDEDNGKYKEEVSAEG